MDKRDHVEIALRAAMIAQSILQLIDCKSKSSAHSVIAKSFDMMLDLDKRIKNMPINGGGRDEDHRS